MSMMSRVAVLLPLLGVAEVKPPTWHWGATLKTCDETCTDKKLHCVGGFWPESLGAMLNATKSAGGGVTKCLDITQRSTSKNPSMTAGNCYYAPPAVIKECAHPATATEQLLCPCHAGAAVYEIADAGESCTEHCRNRGGVCSGDNALWIMTKPEMEAMVKPLGMICATANKKTEDMPAPSIEGDKCYFLEASAGASCSDSKKDIRRFCPCLGAGSAAASTGSAGSSTAAKSPGTGGSGPCRGGGFRLGEGTGGRKKLAPGGLIANNNSVCRERVNRYCPDANGATFSASGDCWCEIGMTGFTASYDGTDGNTVCWFTDGTLTLGTGPIISQFDAGVSTPVEWTAPPTLIAGMALSAVAGLLVGRWRGRNQAEGDHLPLDRFQEAY